MEALSSAASNQLPEVIYEILLRLPTKSLLRFKCVCKSWKAIISDPKFIQSHHTLPTTTTSFRRANFFCRLRETHRGATLHYHGDHEIHTQLFRFPHGVDVFGSCHGLILSRKFDLHPHVFYLWNAAVRKYATLSCPIHFPTASRAGLCYDSDSDDYKIVAIHEAHYCVYSMRNGSWGERKVLFDSKSYDMSFVSVFADGALYWVVTKVNEFGSRLFVSRTYEIVCFDTKEEKFSVVARPELVGSGDMFHLVELGGCLGLYCHDRSGCTFIWLRTGKDCNDASSWGKSMVVSNGPAPSCGLFMNCFITPLCFTRKGDVLVHVAGGGCFLYDVKEKKFHKTDGEPSECCSASITMVMYVDSLFLPGLGNKLESKWLQW